MAYAVPADVLRDSGGQEVHHVGQQTSRPHDPDRTLTVLGSVTHTAGLRTARLRLVSSIRAQRDL